MNGGMKFLRYSLLAALLIAGGAWPGAAQEQTRPATKSAPSPEALRAMKDGVEAMRRSDWKLAAEAWGRTIKLEPGNAGAWANLGKVQLQQKETAAAVRHLAACRLRQGAGHDPADAQHWPIGQRARYLPNTRPDSPSTVFLIVAATNGSIVSPVLIFRSRR